MLLNQPISLFITRTARYHGLYTSLFAFIATVAFVAYAAVIAIDANNCVLCIRCIDYSINTIIAMSGIMALVVSMVMLRWWQSKFKMMYIQFISKQSMPHYYHSVLIIFECCGNYRMLHLDIDCMCIIIMIARRT